MDFTPLIKNALIRILLPPLAGFVVYGAWAFWINSAFGEVAAIKAAFTQGGYSFIITLVLALFVEWLYRLLNTVPKGHWLVGVLACLLLYSSSWGVNALSGTPNILWTMLPGAAVSTVYTVIYIAALIKVCPPSVAKP